MKHTSCILIFFFLCLARVGKTQSFENGASGFEANYVIGNPTSSCLLPFEPFFGGFYTIDGNISSMSVTEGALKLNSNSTITDPYHAGPAYSDLYFVKGQGQDAECTSMRVSYIGDQEDSNYYHIDMTNQTKVVVYAKSDSPTTMRFYLAYAKQDYPERSSSYNAGLVKSILLTSTLTAYELDFSDWAGRDKVNMYGVLIEEPNVTVTIEKIFFGLGNAEIYKNRLKGTIYQDSNLDCDKQIGEKGLEGIIVKADDGYQSYYGMTNINGEYTIEVDSGNADYTITPQINNNRSTQLLSNECSFSHQLTAHGKGNDFCCADFGMKVNNCSLLSIEVNSGSQRRCFQSYSSVSYANLGLSDAESVVVKIIYPEFLIPLSSSPTWTLKAGDTLIYELGTLAAKEEGYISIIDSVVCGIESIRGLTRCLKGTISPQQQCFPIDLAWDGSSIVVSPYCESGMARFVVKNNSLNDMTGDSEYRLYSNDTLIFTSTFKLNAEKSFEIKYPTYGSTMRLEADQRPYHPAKSRPRAFVEGCGTTTVTSKSYVLSVPQDDLEEEVSISCTQITDSYDPNDKEAVPSGITDDHLVKAGEQLKYTIRFQNTGTDIAYNIKVVDTLDVNLDVASFTEGSSSHPYVLQWASDGEQIILNYIFNNINLKDSTTSEHESHGFLSFYINSKVDLADGNTIHNKADIFFDYNSAIVTNIVDHTIGTYVPTDLTKGNKVEVTTGLFEGNESVNSQRVLIYPNPTSDVLQVKLQEHVTDGLLSIADLSGHEVFSANLKSDTTVVSLGIPSGMYLYKVMSNGEFIGIGKLIVK